MLNRPYDSYHFVNFLHHIYLIKTVPTRSTYKPSDRRTPSKKSRIIKKADSSALPIGGHFSVSGRTSADGYKTFSFAVLSASQQRKKETTPTVSLALINA
jgi:hypothetical protein